MKKPAEPTENTPTTPLSFENWLTTLCNSQLAHILNLRPDCALPVPPSFSSLAARLRLPLSVNRAVNQLMTLEVAVVEAAAACGAELMPITACDIMAEIRGRLLDYATPEADMPTEGEVNNAISRLCDYALMYPNDADTFLLLPEVINELPYPTQVLPEPTGVGPVLTHEEIAAQLTKLSTEETKILSALDSVGGVGLSKDAAPDADPDRPVAKLLRKGLITRVDNNTVRLRNYTRDVLGGVHSPRPLMPATRMPDPAPGEAERHKVDQAATASGLDVVRCVRQLLEELGRNPAPCLKDNSIGVRALAKLSKAVDMGTVELARLLCVAEAAGLVNIGEPDPLPPDDTLGNYLAPTPLADDWLAADPAEQWAILFEAWFASSWAPWLVGTKNNNKTIQLFSGESISTRAPSHRALVLQAYTRLPEATPVPRAHLDSDIHYLSPRRAHTLLAAEIEHHRSDAEWIGAIALDTASSALRALTDPDTDLRKVTSTLTPRLGTTLIAQADMTILAPGPLTAAVQHQVETFAEAESLGLASVYRVTEASIRTALDRGHTEQELQRFLEEHTAGEVPQSISYLIADVARRHGTLRSGPALSYLRSDDPALLTQALQTPAATDLGLRLIAPTVAISQAPLIEVLEQLRQVGFQPAAEDAQGARIDVRRNPSRVPHHGRRAPRRDTIDAGIIHGVVTELQRNHAASTAAQSGTTATDAHGQPLQGSQALSVLQAAVRGRTTVTLGFVDKHGIHVQRVVRPLTVAAGQVDALDAATGKVHRFQLHRITEVIVN